MAEPFLAQAQRKIAREQAAREARDAERQAKVGEDGKPVIAGQRARRKPTKKQQNR